MRSVHDHWGELRALRKKLKRADRAKDPAARAVLWARYRELSWALDGMLSAQYIDVKPRVSVRR